VGTERRQVEVKTLGCRLNQAESAELIIALADRGVVSGSRPDVVVINTCAVTGEAATASRKLIRRTIRETPEAQVVVTGCYAVADPETVAAIEGVDVVISEKEQIPALVAGRISGSPVAASFHTPRFDFNDEVVPVSVVTKNGTRVIQHDETIRSGTTAQKLGTLRTSRFSQPDIPNQTFPTMSWWLNCVPTQETIRDVLLV